MASENSVQKPVVCVFCASSPGKSDAHMKAANALARTLYKHSYKLVYGGGTVGMMGELARTLVSLSGPESVHGVTPGPLVRHEAHDPKSQTSGPANTIDSSPYGRRTVVPDMHARKKMMAKEVQEGGPGSGFVALSGGFGTIEELMEMTTWNQLGIHAQAIVAYNVEGYWDCLLAWINQAVEAGFISEANSGIMVSAKQPEDVVKELKEYKVSEGRLKLDWSVI